MTFQDDGEPAVFDRFDRIEAILLRYPDIDEAELADLKRWFGKEASAFEVASLASKDCSSGPSAALPGCSCGASAAMVSV